MEEEPGEGDGKRARGQRTKVSHERNVEKEQNPEGFDLNPALLNFSGHFILFFNILEFLFL